MKNADYRVLDDEFDEERGRRKYCPDEYRPRRCLKDLVMALACGMGIGIGIMTFWYEKRPHLQEEVKTDYHDVSPTSGIELSQKGYEALLQGFRDFGRNSHWLDPRIWNNWCHILGRTGKQVYDGNVKRLLDEVNNPVSPMAKLLCKYRGPKTAPHPSQADEEQYEELCQKYEQYQPTIDAIMDENHDNETTREERNRALYKLFQQ